MSFENTKQKHKLFWFWFALFSKMSNWFCKGFQFKRLSSFQAGFSPPCHQCLFPHFYVTMCLLLHIAHTYHYIAHTHTHICIVTYSTVMIQPQYGCHSRVPGPRTCGQALRQKCLIAPEDLKGPFVTNLQHGCITYVWHNCMNPCAHAWAPSSAYDLTISSVRMC